jgi:hypothetical protein
MMKGRGFEMFVPVLFLAIFLNVSGTQTTACECPTVTANVTYPEGWFLAYDPENAETIEPGTNETINIFGCRPPFTWWVSGNGFDLEWYETEGLFNSFIAGATACGAAEIIVTDKYGESVTGYMRSTTGRWIECYNSGLIAGCSGSQCGGAYELEGHKITYTTCRPGWGGDGLSYECYCSHDGWGGVRTPTIEDVPYDCGTYVNLIGMRLHYWGCP